MSDTKYPNVSFRAGSLEPALTQRGDNIHHTARRDLERYYELLERELPRFDLTQDEASLIVDALNGTIIFKPGDLATATADAIAINRLDTKWHVNGAALVDRLWRLSPARTWALIDGVERFWQRSGEAGRNGEELWQQLRAVGLPWGEDDDDADEEP